MSSAPSPQLPTVSVVIATHNRPARLRTCLTSLAAQDFPRGSFEVVVVDDGSPQPLDAVVEAAAQTSAVRLIRQPKSGPAAARNLGAARAQGDAIAFTDDDCSPEPTWLAELVDCHARAESGAPVMVGGHTVNACDSVFSEASQILIDYLYAYYNSPGDGRAGAQFFTSNNMLMRREHFLALGGFDTSFPLAAGEDRDLCARWVERGWRLVAAPEAVLRHAHMLNAKSFARQHFNYGRGAARYRELRARQNRAPVRVEPLSFYGNLIRFPLAIRRQRGWRWPFAMAQMCLLATTQVANVLGFAFEKSFTMRNEKSVRPKATPAVEERP